MDPFSDWVTIAPLAAHRQVGGWIWRSASHLILAYCVINPVSTAKWPPGPPPSWRLDLAVRKSFNFSSLRQKTRLHRQMAAKSTANLAVDLAVRKSCWMRHLSQNSCLHRQIHRGGGGTAPARAVRQGRLLAATLTSQTIVGC